MNRNIGRTNSLLVILAFTSLLLAITATYAAHQANSRSSLRYLACSEPPISPSLSRCPPEDDRAVLARTLTAWTVARYTPNGGWVTTTGEPVRSRVIDWVTLPDSEPTPPTFGQAPR